MTTVSERASGGKRATMKRRAKTEFEAWAKHYDRSLLNHFLFKPSYVLLMEEIARWYAEHQRPFRTLDVGCGTGSLVEMLARSSWPVEPVGLDYSANMCIAADHKLRGARLRHAAKFVNADSEHLPFDDGSVDIITCANSFHHYPHQAEVVRDMHRVLADGGRLILIDGFRDCVIGWVVFDVIIGHIEGGVHHAPWPEIHQHFEQAGFNNIRRRKFNFWFPAFATIGDR